MAFDPPKKIRSSSTRRRPFDRRTARRWRASSRHSVRPTPNIARDAILAQMQQQSAGHGDYRGDVPGQQAGTGARRLSRTFLRRGNLRIARGCLCRRSSQGRAATDRRYLQHVSAAQLRPDLSGSGPAEFAGGLHDGSSGTERTRRSDSSWQRSTSATCDCFPTWS